MMNWRLNKRIVPNQQCTSSEERTSLAVGVSDMVCLATAPADILKVYPQRRLTGNLLYEAELSHPIDGLPPVDIV
jgi:hypothetical protein